MQTQNKSPMDQREKMNGPGVLSEQTFRDFTESVSDLSERVKDVSSNIAQESIAFAKKYPIHTAIGAALVGFFIGAFSQKAMK